MSGNSSLVFHALIHDLSWLSYDVILEAIYAFTKVPQ